MLKYEQNEPQPEVQQRQTRAGTGQRFPCSGCGADMEFDPKSGGLQCPYCGNTEGMKTALTQAGSAIEERDFAAYLTPRAEQMRRLSESAVEVQCSGCGSTVEFEPPEVAGLCPFCGAKIVAQPRAADPLVAPEGVLPFSIPQKDATTSIRTWVKSRWLAPNALKRQAQQGAIGGVYLPFWTYDAQTYTRYSGQRGEHYWESESYTTTENGKSVRKTRQVRKTRWYSASGDVSRFFDDVLIAATRSLPRPKLDALEPWGLEAIQPYEPAYLSGFKAQRYQINLAEGFETAKQVMAATIEADVRRDIGGDEQRIHSLDTRYRDITFKHLLLPVWISAYRYEQKVFQVIVNARTGEVQGDRPYSIWKIGALVVTVLALIALYYYYFQSPGSSGNGARVGYNSPISQTIALRRATPSAAGRPTWTEPGRAGYVRSVRQARSLANTSITERSTNTWSESPSLGASVSGAFPRRPAAGSYSSRTRSSRSSPKSRKRPYFCAAAPGANSAAISSVSGKSPITTSSRPA